MEKKGNLSDIEVIALDGCCDDCEHWSNDSRAWAKSTEKTNEEAGVGSSTCEFYADEEFTSWG